MPSPQAQLPLRDRMTIFQGIGQHDGRTRGRPDTTNISLLIDLEKPICQTEVLHDAPNRGFSLRPGLMARSSAEPRAQLTSGKVDNGATLALGGEFGQVPPADNSTSSGWAPKATTSMLSAGKRARQKAWHKGTLPVVAPKALILIIYSFIPASKHFIPLTSTAMVEHPCLKWLFYAPKRIRERNFHFFHRRGFGPRAGTGLATASYLVNWTPRTRR